MENKKMVLKGLVYVKQGAIGMKPEGPDYFLQTHDKDYKLGRMTAQEHWNIDYHLEFFCRKWVEIEGTFDERELKITDIRQILVDRMPK